MDPRRILIILKRKKKISICFLFSVFTLFSPVCFPFTHKKSHNWTGNRVTLRDWFQLSLKEGLTVFREQVEQKNGTQFKNFKQKKISIHFFFFLCYWFKKFFLILIFCLKKRNKKKEFSADRGNRGVERIDNTMVLRSSQFKVWFFFPACLFIFVILPPLKTKENSSLSLSLSLPLHRTSISAWAHQFYAWSIWFK